MSELNTWQEWSRGNYRVTTSPDALDLEAVYGFLSTTSWANGLSRSLLSRAISHSLCFSLLKDQRQIGLSRVITDYATYAYLCDVYIAEAYRGQGLGHWMMQCVLDHTMLGGLKRIALLTHDAEGFYRELGFVDAKQGSIYLERLRPKQEAASSPHHINSGVPGLKTLE